MHVSRNILGLAAGMLAALVVQAQAPAGAPAGSTGLCKDGSYYSGATKQGACRGHKGVKDWYGASATAAPAAAAPAAMPAATSKSAKKAAAAAAPAAMASGPAPSGATGLCNDGSYYSGASKKGACRGHKGVKDWYGAATAASPAAPAAPAAAAATAAPAPRAPAPAAAPAPATPAAAAAPATPVAAAPGGGPGLVWVNTKSKVYHCQSDSMYGRTKEGAYMSEAAATAAGDRPARGKACH